MCRDRTVEFALTIESVRSRTTGHSDPLINHRPSSPAIHGSQQAFRVQTEFMQRAVNLNTGIAKILSRLDKLSKLTKAKTLFDDRPVEIQELTQIVKRDLAESNQQIAQLQKFQKSASGSSGASSPKQGVSVWISNRNSEEHASNVIVSLQSKLATASSLFTQILEQHTQNIKAQKDRREQFSATSIMPIVPSGRPQSPRPRKGANLAAERGHDDHVAIELPGSPTSGGYQKLALMQETDTAYLQSRSNALQGVEATINELGRIYQQLARMIAEQGEVVERIDMNIENMHSNVQRGQDQLLRYLRSVSSNRWLLVKIFSVLVAFIFVFVLFFA